MKRQATPTEERLGCSPSPSVGPRELKGGLAGADVGNPRRAPESDLGKSSKSGTPLGEENQIQTPSLALLIFSSGEMR